MKVTVYYSPSCPWCDKLKEWLREHKIAFQDIDVSLDMKAAQEMVKKSGQMGVPVVEIRKAHSVGIIVGFDIKKLKDALNIK